MRKFSLVIIAVFLATFLLAGTCWAKPGHGHGHGNDSSSDNPGKSSVEKSKDNEEDSEEKLEYTTGDGQKVEIKDGKVEIKGNGSKFEMKDGKVEYKSKNGKVEINGNKAEVKGNGILNEFKEKMQNQQKADTKNKFKDVKNHWAREAINSISSIGLVNGYEDNTFKPDKPITQAETISLLMRLVPDNETAENTGEDEIEEETEEQEEVEEETDTEEEQEDSASEDEEVEEEEEQEDSVSEDKDGEVEEEEAVEEETEEQGPPEWAKASVNKAEKKGVVNINRFHSHVQASRAQAAVWIARAMELEPADTSDINFNDAYKISEEDIGCIRALTAEGIIAGTPDGKFNPNSAITRAQMAAIMERLLAEEEETEENAEEETKDENTEETTDQQNSEENTDEETSKETSSEDTTSEDTTNEETAETS
ncbi:MAG: S-layer homology domain-containing protein [Clostridiales bacterium]|nr:S-layer homology domain-containing protein [Clostridiales bacterium]MCF8022833.1 S-layer homology domain-containing protein [Clostridiales bacterium]